jgi:acyl-CoA reductase-like NAD-dependent aldehyde dehydrogenase
VDDPRTRFIAFTGSKEVGMRIFERAAKVHPGQIWLKRTILEMGGKDSIVVDETADLDAAAQGIVARRSGSRARSAPPARAPSSSMTSTTRCWRRWWRAARS